MSYARDILHEYGREDETGMIVFADPADEEIVDCIKQDESTIFFREDL
jgi:hypothetical protein